MDALVQQLSEVEVLTPKGERARLGAAWEGRNVLLAMIRHFG